MGSFFSTMFTPPPAGDDGDSRVVAVHSKATYDELWGSHTSNPNKLIVIDFSATWCGPCRFIEPAFKEMASRFTDAAFLKIDVDELSEVARQWNVEAMPSFVLVKGGKEVSRVVGARKDELERKINIFWNGIASCKLVKRIASNQAKQSKAIVNETQGPEPDDDVSTLTDRWSHTFQPYPLRFRFTALLSLTNALVKQGKEVDWLVGANKDEFERNVENHRGV
uniref:Thioredoxin domain-containing protein n=1 Tax=Leersia perrieri TaxID=77586 RepID=A0A0D9W087_9ORYZ